MPELGASWNRLRSILKKQQLLKEYVTVVELQERAEPHLHVIATGEYIPQKKLAAWGEQSGFGRCSDIRAVRGTGPRSITGYVLKQLSNELAGYVTKARVSQLKERAANDGHAKRKQVRPVRVSRGWYPGGLKAAEQAALRDLSELMGREEESDPGPWFVVLKRADGGVSVVSRPKPIEPVERPQPEGARPSAATTGEESENTARLARAA
jgi:hypothetical protein